MRVVKDNGCRTCGHGHYWVVSSFDVDDCVYSSCKCKKEDWMPYDNLEYLEAMNEKRSLKND